VSPDAAKPPSRVVLVGFMGSGKTTVGAELAALLGWGFVDLDRRIELREGKSVAAIFRESGEQAFRALEREAAREAGRLARHVVAAGGGAFAQDETRRLLREGALCVWLRCDFPTSLRRAGGDAARPLASDRERMRALFAEREPCYRLADVVVETSETTPAQAARAVLLALGPKLPGECAPR
jgi:shikimate kinase/3-dehydroquinate synthase